jgi:hypothetical protein
LDISSAAEEAFCGYAHKILAPGKVLEVDVFGFI